MVSKAKALSEYIRDLDNHYFSYSPTNKKGVTNKSAVEVINKLFSVLKNYINNELNPKDNKIVLLAARERIGFDDGLMKGIFIDCENSELKKAFKKKISTPLEINTDFFTNEKKFVGKKKQSSLLKPYLVKKDTSGKKYTINNHKKYQDSLYCADTKKNSFYTRLNDFFKGKDHHTKKMLIDPDDISIKSLVVYGRDYSKVRIENSKIKSEHDDYIDQIIAIYFDYDLLDSIKEAKLGELLELLDEIFNRIDLIRVLSLLSLERKFTEIIATRLPIAIKHKESPAKTIKIINNKITKELIQFLDDNYGLQDGCSLATDHEVLSTFVHLGQRKDSSNKKIIPEFRPFPESCGMNVNGDLPLDKQFVLRYEKYTSLSKYFIYLCSMAEKKSTKHDCLSNKFKALFEGDDATDSKIQKSRIASIRKQITKNDWRYIRYSESSETTRKNKNEEVKKINLPWRYNESIFSDNDDEKNHKGSSLIYGFKLGKDEFNKYEDEVDENLSLDINTLLILESKEVYLFDDEIVACIDKVIPLYISMLEIMPLARNYIDYEEKLRNEYFKNIVPKNNNWDIHGYEFTNLAFDLFRTNLITFKKDFLSFTKLAYSKNGDPQLKNCREAVRYINGIYTAIKDKYGDADIFNDSINNNFRKEYIALINKQTRENIKSLQNKYRALQIKKKNHIKKIAEQSNRVKEDRKVNPNEANTPVIEIKNAINDNPDLSKYFIEFIKSTHSCIVWSSWLGAIRMILMKRFDDTNGAGPEIQLIDSGYSALELLVVNTESEKIKQVIKLGEKDKLEIEKNAYNKYVRYQITEAARIPSDGFCYLCDGAGIFEFGTLLSDLVGFKQREGGHESTLKSLLTPINNEHAHNQQIPFGVEANSLTNILKTLFDENLGEWKENSNSFNTSASNLIKGCFRISDFEVKSGLDFKVEVGMSWSDLIKLKEKPPYEVVNFRQSLSDLMNGINHTMLGKHEGSKTLDRIINNFKSLDNEEAVLPCQKATIHGDLTFYNILMAGGETPVRPILIDFEHVKQGFYGADLIHLMFNSLTNHISLRDFLNVQLFVSLAHDPDDVGETVFKEDTVFYRHVYETFKYLGSFRDELFNLFDTTPRDEYKYPMQDSRLGGESVDCIIKEDLISFLTDDEDVLGKKEAKTLRIKAIHTLCSAFLNTPRRLNMYKLLESRLIKEINTQKDQIKIKSKHNNERITKKFWYYAMLSSSFVQLVYSLLNVLNLCEQIFGKDKGINNFNIHAKLLESFKYEELKSFAFYSVPLDDDNNFSKFLKEITIQTDNKGHQHDLLAGWLSVLISMHLLNIIMLRIEE